jgi:hypothetical protein
MAAGRSPTAAIPPGTADATLTLTLQPTAVVQGFVRRDGKPAEAVIGLRAADAADSNLIVRTGPDGSYRFDRVAPGRYSQAVTQNRGQSDDSQEGKTRALDVPAGGVVNRDVDLTPSGVSVVLHLTSPNNVVRFGYGGLVMVDADRARTITTPRSVSELRATMSQLQDFEIREGLIVDRQQIRLDRIRPGLVFVCAAALRGDPQDPSVTAELEQHVVDWPLSCKRLELPGAPDLQHLTLEVLPPPPRK